MCIRDSSKPVAVETTVANDKKELPNTGTEDKSGLASLGPVSYTHLDVYKRQGYDIVDNPFDKNPVFDTLKDTTDKVSQEFIIKVQPRVSTAYPVYVVEGTKPSSEQLKDAVSTKGNDKTVDETKIPETTGKVGDDSLTVPITVTYGSGDKKREETVNVPVKVVKGYPQIVPVDEDKKQPYPEDSIDPDQYPEGSTFEYKEEVNTSEAGDKNVTVRCV